MESGKLTHFNQNDYLMQIFNGKWNHILSFIADDEKLFSFWLRDNELKISEIL